MKYLLLVYGNPRTWEHPMFAQDPGFLALPEAERDALLAQSNGLHDEIVASGELVSASALADPVTVTSVRVRDGRPVTTDGPYIETKEQLAGYFVLDCESLERATEIAARFPDARFTGVELRPIMSSHGQEM